MASYNKKGERAFKLAKQKDAVKQLNNFATIMANMQELYKLLDEYPSLLTADNIKEVAEAMNKEKSLKLDDNQLNIVIKKFTEPMEELTKQNESEDINQEHPIIPSGEL